MKISRIALLTALITMSGIRAEDVAAAQIPGICSRVITFIANKTGAVAEFTPLNKLLEKITTPERAKTAGSVIVSTATLATAYAFYKWYTSPTVSADEDDASFIDFTYEANDDEDETGSN
jgi:hypothetical protein